MRSASLLLVCAALAVAQAPANLDVITLSDGTSCGLEGTARSEAGKALNRLKNRYRLPQAGDIDPEVSLAAMLAPGDDVDRFDARKAAKVAGYAVAVRPGGKETCNCQAADPLDRDTIIELALSKDAPASQRVVVEITPRLRALMKGRGQDWASAALQDPRTGLKGKWVEVTGWLLFDTPELNDAENTHPGGPRNRRATCWEIHPVTSLKALDAPPTEFSGVHPAVFREFHQAQILQVKRVPERLEAMQSRNKKKLAQFHKDELEDD